MASKRSQSGTKSRRTTTGSGSRSRSTGTTRRSTKKPPPSSLSQFSISPQQQRELFALGLILIGALTLVFSLADDPGTLGASWTAAVRQAFGRGSVIVPLALLVVGGLIIWQERTKDERLSGSNVVGTIFILMSLLMLLDYPYLDRDPVHRVGEGGGVVGYTLMHLLSMTISKAGALLVALFIGIVGIMLTFNITFYELIGGTYRYSRMLGRKLIGTPPQRETVIEGEFIDELPPPPPSRRQRQLAAAQAHDELEELVLTPIAERPAPARLFQRAAEVPPTERNKRDRKRKSEAAVALDQAVAVDVHDRPTERIEQLPLSSAPAQQRQHAEPEEQDDDLTLEGPHRAWPLPPMELLDSYTEGEISDEERREKARIIEETLASFKVEARVVEVNTGPAVTQFALQPATGVKVSKITTLASDLALALAAPSIRIEAPVPGRSVVGIEIPNSVTSAVSLREVYESAEYETSRAKLKLPLGKDVSGSVVVADMTKMPHVLIAGATGSGKSICINAVLCSLLLRHTPDELKLIMVDPKMVELITYNQIPHLLTPVITELERVVSALKWAVREMERRYKIFAQKGFRNIDSYNKASRKRADLEPMPFILVVIDELADLMMMAPDEVETLICRLAQMARATGIHLVIATQRPSVDVVTGLIKANFPSRVAFAVSSQIDSRVILDTPGAEQLLGRGDSLFLSSDSSKPVRIQGTYVSDPEVERIVNFWRAQRPPEEEAGAEGGQATPSAVSADGTSAAPADPAAQPGAGTTMGDTFLSAEEEDELLPKAIELVRQHQRASASLLQRRLRIGYTKAAQVIDLLEQRGVVGPAESGRSREVLHNNHSE